MVLEVVLLAGVVVAALFLLVSHWLVVPADDLDVDRQERWLVQHAPARLRRVLGHADRRLVGGAATAVLFAVVLAGAALVGWVFDGVDDNAGIAQWDDAAARWSARRATPSTTPVLEVLTHLGGTQVLAALMVVVGSVTAWRRRDVAVYGYLALVGVGIVALNNGLKEIVDRERPDVMRVTATSGASFPSGHSAAAAACWAAIMLVVALRWRRPARHLAAAFAVLVAGIVAATRIVLGAHWLTDVVAGVAVGWTWFVVVTVLFGGRLLRFGEPSERAARTAGGPGGMDPTGPGSTRAGREVLTR